MTDTRKTVSRRRFLRQTSAGVALFNIVPASYVLGGAAKSPNEKINIAAIGGGGRAARVIDGCASENIIAIADVDDRRAAKTYEKHPDAKRYRDYRIMLDEVEDQIDAVIVGTPDHTHAPACIDAIERGKHVYCEKPLAHTIFEVRLMTEAAQRNGVITQVGNQGHSSDSIRQFVEWVWDGAIGEVTEVHATCSAFREVYAQTNKAPMLKETHEVPKELDWDLWLGPAAQRSYNPVYLPFAWRGWMPFGTGCIGDWICHVVDPSLWALGLGPAKSVHAEVDESYDPKKHHDFYPAATKITFEFDAPAPSASRTSAQGPVKLVWYDGANKMPRPEGIPEDVKMPGVGALAYGKEGMILHGSHGAHNSQIYPVARAKEYTLPDPSIPRVKGHQVDWLNAIRSGKEAGSPFEYGGALTELGLLGAIAVRFPSQKLEWDSDSLRFTNFEAANAYVHPPYREGWEIRRRLRV